MVLGRRQVGGTAPYKRATNLNMPDRCDSSQRLLASGSSAAWSSCISQQLLPSLQNLPAGMGFFVNTIPVSRRFCRRSLSFSLCTTAFHWLQCKIASHWHQYKNDFHPLQCKNECQSYVNTYFHMPLYSITCKSGTHRSKLTQDPLCNCI